MTLSSFDPEVLALIVNFIYTAEIQLSTDNVQKICTACNELELDELKDGCDKHSE